MLALLFMDFLDGAVARHQRCSSTFGAIFDGVADVIFLLSTLVGLAIRGENNLALALLVAYSFDTALRVLLGHSISLINRGSDRYQRANRPRGLIDRIRPYVYPLINYFDSIAALALILIFKPGWLAYWMMYELARRLLVTYKKVRELYLIYGEDRDAMS